MKIVGKFSSMPWDSFNFALERLALILCSMSTRDLTDYQMQAAARVRVQIRAAARHIDCTCIWTLRNLDWFSVCSAGSARRSRGSHVTLLQVSRSWLRVAVSSTWKRGISYCRDWSDRESTKKRRLSIVQEVQGRNSRYIRSNTPTWTFRRTDSRAPWSRSPRHDASHKPASPKLS